jgi:hypothetical protein
MILTFFFFFVPQPPTISSKPQLLVNSVCRLLSFFSFQMLQRKGVTAPQQPPADHITGDRAPGQLTPTARGKLALSSRHAQGQHQRLLALHPRLLTLLLQPHAAHLSLGIRSNPPRLQMFGAAPSLLALWLPCIVTLDLYYRTCSSLLCYYRCCRSVFGFLTFA